MSAQISHLNNESEKVNQNTYREESEMSAIENLGPSNLNGSLQELKATLEGIEMKLVSGMKNIKNILFEGRRVKTTVTMIGGLALGAMLLTSIALPYGTAHGDEPGRPVSKESIVTVRGQQPLPDDAWMQDSPFYEDFSAGSSADVGTAAVNSLGISDDAWMMNAPFYEDFSKDSKVVVGTAAVNLLGISDDAWMMDAPFYEDFSTNSSAVVATAALNSQGISDDAWMMDAPFYEDFSADSSAVVATAAVNSLGISDDAWMQDSPFYQDFSEGSGDVVGAAALDSQVLPDDAWIYDSPFYDIP